MTLCTACSSSGCGGSPCARLERLLEPQVRITARGLTEAELTGPVRLMGSSGLTSFEPVRVSLSEIAGAAPSEFRFDFLKSSDNTLLNAFHVQGLSYKQIARRYRIKKNSIGPRLARLRRTIALSASISRDSTQKGAEC